MIIQHNNVVSIEFSLKWRRVPDWDVKMLGGIDSGAVVSAHFFSYIFQTIRAYLPLAAGRPQRKRATNPKILRISEGFGVYGLKNQLCEFRFKFFKTPDQSY